jgi:hypothetical protein
MAYRWPENVRELEKPWKGQAPQHLTPPGKIRLNEQIMTLTS